MKIKVNVRAGLLQKGRGVNRGRSEAKPSVVLFLQPLTRRKELPMKIKVNVRAGASLKARGAKPRSSGGKAFGRPLPSTLTRGKELPMKIKVNVKAGAAGKVRAGEHSAHGVQNFITSPSLKPRKGGSHEDQSSRSRRRCQVSRLSDSSTSHVLDDLWIHSGPPTYRKGGSHEDQS